MNPKAFVFNFLFFASLLSFSISSQATTLKTVASLIVLCGTKNPSAEVACEFYIQGVIEAWMVKELAMGEMPSEIPKANGKRGLPNFCEAIYSVSDKDLVDTIRSNLSTIQPGTAPYAVMETLSKKYCK